MNEERPDDESIAPAEIAVLALGRLRQGVRTRPLFTLAAVFGAGFVLGRGLPTFVVRLGSAFALQAISERLIGRMQSGGASIGGDTSGAEPSYDDPFGG